MNQQKMLEKLKAERAMRREQERAELAAQSTKQSGAALLLNALKDFSNPRTVLRPAIILVGIALIAVVSNQIYIRLAPEWALDNYKENYAAGDLEVAEKNLAAYLEMRPADIPRRIEYAQLLYQQNKIPQGNSVIEKVLENPEFTDDNDVLFYSGLSMLPNTSSSRGVMDRILIGFKSFLPALVLRSITNLDTDLNSALQDINEAGERALQMTSTQEGANRYRRMIIDMLFTICNLHPTILDNRVSAGLDSFPEFFEGKGLYIYGADSTFDANFCGMLNERGRMNFAPNLQALVHMIKAHVNIRRKAYRDASAAVGSSRSSGGMAETDFLEAILFVTDGEIQTALRSFLKLGLRRDPATFSNIATAQILLGEDQWEEAKDNYNMSLRFRPDNPLPLNNRGVLSMVNDNPGQAKNDFLEALKSDHAYPHPIYNLAILNLLFDDNPKRAIQQLRTQSSAKQIFPGTYYWLASAIHQAENIESSIPVLKRATQSRFFSIIANTELGDFYSGSELSWSLAEQYYRNAYIEFPNNYKAPLRLANLYAQQNRYDEAEELIAEIAENSYDEDSEVRAEIVALRGIINYYKGNFAEARNLLKQALATTKNDDLRIRITPTYSEILVSLELVREALDLTRSVLPLDPENIKLLVSRAFALALGKDVGQALKVISTALEISGGRDYDVLIAAGDINALNRNWNEALDAYRNATRLVPISTLARRKTLEILERIEPANSEKLSLARDDLERSLRLEGQRSKIGVPKLEGNVEKLQKIDLSHTLLSKEAVETTRVEIVNLTELIERGSVDRYTALLNRAGMHAQIGDLDKAVADFVTTAKENPDKSLPFANLGHLYVAMDQLENAEKAYTAALQNKYPQMAQIYFQRAQVRNTLGNNDGAIKDYSQVIGALPEFAQAYFFRGLIYLNRGDYDPAISDFTHVISIDPEFIGAYRSRRQAFQITGQAQKAAQDSEYIAILRAR